METVSIRGARKEDASQAAWLFMMAWPVEDFLAMDPSLTLDGLHGMVMSYFLAEDTLYSYTNTVVATVTDSDGNEKVAGAINGYDGALYEELKRPITEDLRKRFPSSENDFGAVKETEAGEYYLDSIGVDPAMRSHGIGSRLFKAAIARASDAGFKRIGLIVDEDKPKAEALYLRLGFRNVGYRDFFGHRMKHMQIEIE